MLVDPQFVNDSDIFDRVYQATMYLYHFIKFSASRLGCMPTSARGALSGVSVGLDALVAFVRDQPGVSEEYIHCYDKFTAQFRKVCVGSALVGWVTDVWIFEIMRDDRVARRVDELREALQEELRYLATLPTLVWERLLQLSGDL